ncbi:MAG: NfeD family protein [Marinobacter sp.]|nr:NfeD family protein [Marinobacter sp.]
MFDMSIPTWVMLVIGLLLVMAELFATLFILLWFGLGFITVAFLGLLVPELNIGVQLALSVGLGAMYLALFRKRFRSRLPNQPSTLTTFQGSVDGELALNANGRFTVLANGTYWQPANLEVIAEPLRREGQRVRVEGFENNRAVLKPLE